MNPRILLLTGFGIGRVHFAPGTWASLIPVAWAGLLLSTVGVKPLIMDGTLLLMALISSIICVRFGHEGERHYEGKDASPIVADEIAGQALVLLALPWRPGDSTWNLMLAGTAFATFRFFDILKPPPIRRLQAIHGGWGILLDDLLAAAYAAAVTQTVARLALPLMI